MMTHRVDLLIVGGGINGTGIARDAAGRGLSVLLCEKDDLASHTSSASTKLIHGGLRYLEQYQFGLVRKALKERDILLRLAPHIIRPMMFVMPHAPQLRPAWLIRLGLFLYDHLSQRNQLAASSRIDLKQHVAGAPLQNHFSTGFIYADAWVDDARLVVLNALSAQEKGATILTRTTLLDARPHHNMWDVILKNHAEEKIAIQARTIVNATGPWASHFLHQLIKSNSLHHDTLRWVKGSHIIVPRLFDHPYAYIFQHIDHRIIFALPYLEQYTLIGTTDVPYHGSLDKVCISQEEVVYLCDAVNHYFKQPITPQDVIWHYAGVRPLLEDHTDNPSEITRDYALQLTYHQTAPILSIFGGKLTTYRRLAEDSLQLLSNIFPHQAPSWTQYAPLPGGAYQDGDTSLFLEEVYTQYSWLPRTLAQRYAQSYGTRITLLLGQASNMDDLGQAFSSDLFEAEVRYLVTYEWAREADDILWRRTKLGLTTSKEAVAQLTQWLHYFLHQPCRHP